MWTSFMARNVHLGARSSLMYGDVRLKRRYDSKGDSEVMPN